MGTYFKRFEGNPVIFLHWKMKMYRRSKRFKWLEFAAPHVSVMEAKCVG